MAKYIIKVEQVEGTFDQEFAETFGDGIECDGFLIVGDTHDANSTCIHHMTLIDLAKALNSSKTLSNAAVLATALGKVDFMLGGNNDD